MDADLRHRLATLVVQAGPGSDRRTRASSVFRLLSGEIVRNWARCISFA